MTVQLARTEVWMSKSLIDVLAVLSQIWILVWVRSRVLLRRFRVGSLGVGLGWSELDLLRIVHGL